MNVHPRRIIGYFNWQISNKVSEEEKTLKW